MQTPTQNTTANTTDRHPLQYVLATAVILSGAAFALRAFADSALPTWQQRDATSSAVSAQAATPKPIEAPAVATPSAAQSTNTAR